MLSRKKDFEILLANRASATQILLAQQEIHWPRASEPVLISTPGQCQPVTEKCVNALTNKSIIDSMWTCYRKDALTFNSVNVSMHWEICLSMPMCQFISIDKNHTLTLFRKTNWYVNAHVLT